MSSPLYTESQSTVYRDAEVEARSLSTDALLAGIEVFALDIEDPDPEWPGATGSWLAAERLKAFETELERRVRIIQLPDSKAARFAKDSEHWAALARDVRETVSITEALLLIGIAPVTTGNEAHSACPWCGGADRFVSWDHPRPRYWCRQCDRRGNAIDLVMAHYAGMSHFRDAVKFLASLASLTGGRS